MAVLVGCQQERQSRDNTVTEIFDGVLTQGDHLSENPECRAI